MKKHFLLTVFVLTVIIIASAQNPFAHLGYDVPIATSSKGKFEEFHGLTRMVEIGSVIYDTKTKKITGFVEQEKREKEVSPVTTAMSIDPLCEKYYWISPYAFCLNNPVRYIDPDGREVWAIYEDENGKRQQLQYKDGNLYDTKGNLYEGNNADALAILEALNYIKDVDDFTAEVIGTLESSDKKHFVEHGEKGKSLPYPRTHNSYIAMNKGVSIGSQNVVNLNDNTIEGSLKNTKETGLAHELRHAYDSDQGLYKGEEPGRNSTADNAYEQRAVGFENRARKSMGLPLRTTYGKKEIKPYPYAK